MKNKVQLITYADGLGDGILSSMTDILRTRFNGVYDGVHILPFFTPFDGADAGFDPISTPRSTRASARGMTSPNSHNPRHHGRRHRQPHELGIRPIPGRAEERRELRILPDVPDHELRLPERRYRRRPGRHLPPAPGPAVHPLQPRRQDPFGMGQLHPAAGGHRH